jgi:hypothetical protein
MSAVVIFVSSGLLIYWFSRTLLLLKGSEEEIHQVLEADVWWGRTLLIGLRTMFRPPTQLAS